MKTHLVQLNIDWENPTANLRRTADLVAQASRSGAMRAGDLVVLPEMFDTGFSCNIGTTADRNNETLTFLQSLAREHGVFVNGARTTIGADGRGRNTAPVIGPDGRVMCEYQKLHLFPLGQAQEASVFGPGPGVMVYEWGNSPTTVQTHAASRSVETTLIVCPTICYDLRFAEVYRLGLAMGAEVFIVSSSWPIAREAHRRALSIARAIENQAYVISVNRCGRDPNLEYAGGSLVIDPRGEVAGELGCDEGVLSVEIDPREVRRWRSVFPAWQDRRPVRPA